MLSKLDKHRGASQTFLFFRWAQSGHLVLLINPWVQHWTAPTSYYTWWQNINSLELKPGHNQHVLNVCLNLNPFNPACYHDHCHTSLCSLLHYIQGGLLIFTFPHHWPQWVLDVSVLCEIVGLQCLCCQRKLHSSLSAHQPSWQIHPVMQCWAGCQTWVIWRSFQATLTDRFIH